jgi:hypothetical protein
MTRSTWRREVEVSYLPHADEHRLWSGLLKLLRPAAEIGGIEPWEPGDIVWIASDGVTIYAAMVTRLVDDRAEIRCLAGTRMAEWLPEWARIFEDWARKCGATTLECRGRKGWGRFAARYGWSTAGHDERGLPMFTKMLPMVSVPRVRKAA